MHLIELVHIQRRIGRRAPASSIATQSDDGLHRSNYCTGLGMASKETFPYDLGKEGRLRGSWC